MGGFVLNLKNNSGEIDLTIFKERGQLESFSISKKSFRLVKYKKNLFDRDVLIFEDKSDIVLGFGTLSYKGLGIKEGFINLTHDLLNGCLDHNQICK